MTTDPPGDVEAEVTRPPWTLNVPVVEITQPQPPAVAVSLPRTATVSVPWPRVQVAQDPLPPALREIRLAAPPQGPWRLPLPGGHPLRTMWVLPARRR